MFSSSASNSRDRKRLLRIVFCLARYAQRKKHDLVLGLAERMSGYEPDCWVCQQTNPTLIGQTRTPQHKSESDVGCCFGFRIVRAGRTTISAADGSTRPRLIHVVQGLRGWLKGL